MLLLVLTIGQKGMFETAEHRVQQFAAQLVHLDHTLRDAGPEGAPAREWLFRYTVRTMQALWPDHARVGRLPSEDAAAALVRLRAAVAQMPHGEAAGRALYGVETARQAVSASSKGGVSLLLTGFTLFWLMLTFAGAGLWAPLGPGPGQPAGRAGGGVTTLAVLFVVALVLGGAMFLLREYNDPFSGVIVVSHEPLQSALFAISE